MDTLIKNNDTRYLQLRIIMRAITGAVDHHHHHDDTETPIDITGAVITMTLRRIGSTGAIIDTKTVEDGLTITMPRMENLS